MKRAEVERTRALLGEVGAALASVKTKGGILDDIAWPREVEERFFAAGAGRLPDPSYAVDRAPLDAEIAGLAAAQAAVLGDGPVETWLRAVLGSVIDRNRLLAAVGTREFGRVSREVYGGARSALLGLGATNLDLARHVLDRLRVHGWDEAKDTSDPGMDAPEFADWLRERVAKRRLDLEVIVDEACTSKAIASSRRVRVRSDARFSAWEAEGLYRHEVETHAYSALNGAAQEHAPFLKGGGPRSTPTQEGLAVFTELWHHALAVPRLERLAVRVETVAMGEDGASFLDVYRWLIDRGAAPRDAYLDAARVFRGGPPEGGGAFTKDACYLAGLVDVFSFLAAFVRGGFRDECEMLVCGRFALDDVAALVTLRAAGLLSRPKHRPRWLREWGTLLPYFAFTSFFDGLDLGEVEARHAQVIAIARAATPPE